MSKKCVVVVAIGNRLPPVDHEKCSNGLRSALATSSLSFSSSACVLLLLLSANKENKIQQQWGPSLLLMRNIFFCLRVHFSLVRVLEKRAS
jgi:hypothetical protein